jgi:hypothetical protein
MLPRRTTTIEFPAIDNEKDNRYHKGWSMMIAAMMVVRDFIVSDFIES